MRSPLETHPVLLKALHALQIIVIALLVGVLIFSAFVLYRLANGDGPLGESAGALTPILLIASVLAVGLTTFLRARVLESARRRITDGTWKPPAQRSAAGSPLAPSEFEAAGVEGRLVQTRMLTTIIGAAGLEGAALLCLIAALLEANPLALGAAGLWGFLLALQVPTRRGLEQWLESESQKLRQ